MVVIRLARGGSRNRPFHYIVVADSRARRDGRFIEKLGFHNPIAGEKDLEPLRINSDRLQYWVSVGAQLSPTVKRLVTKYNKAAGVASSSEKSSAKSDKAAKAEA